MYRIDALYSKSRQHAINKLKKLCAHIYSEEGVHVYIHDLTYRGDNVWMYTLKEYFPDKGYLLGGNHYHGRNCNGRNQDLG